MKAETTTAMLVDDHAVVRAGIRLLLDSQTSMSVVAEASSAEEALQVSLDRDPDLIVTDLSMDGLRGAAVIEAFAERSPTRGSSCSPWWTAPRTFVGRSTRERGATC